MEANELMIGDWVCYCKPNNYYTKVNEIKCTHDVPDDTIYYIEGQRDNRDRLKTEFDESFVADIISPVPLTKGILWKICDKVNIFEDNVHEYTEYIFNDDAMVVSEKDIPFVFEFENADGEHIYKKIEYMHELQLLLKLVGIDKTIEL